MDARVNPSTLFEVDGYAGYASILFKQKGGGSFEIVKRKNYLSKRPGGHIRGYVSGRNDRRGA
jgi:hypothetical protein